MRRLMFIAGMLACPASGLAQEVDMAPPAHVEPGAVVQSGAEFNRGEIGRRIAAAAAGDTVEIGPGVYREHIRIDKPLRLIGVGRPVIDGGGAGDIVEIAAAGVEFRGFLVRNTGIDLGRENAAIRVLAERATVEDNILEDILFGIDMRSASGSIVRGNRVGGKDLDIARRGDGIRLWRTDDTLVENNTFHDGRDAILWYSNGVTVRGNRGFRCRYGLHLMFSDNVRIEENELFENSVGIYLMYSTGVEVHRNRLVRNRGPSGYGLGLKETDRFAVSQNVFLGNRVGVYIDGSPFTTEKPGEFFRNTFAHNDIGITMLPSVKGNMIWENNFIDNIEQVAISGRGQLKGNQFWKEDAGNFWTDYSGYDQDGNGIGDFMHESYTLFENLLDREPKLRILLFSPLQQAIEFVGRAIPAVRPEPKFVDEVPLMRPVDIAVAGSVGASSASRPAMAGAAAGLLGIGLFVVWASGGVALTRAGRRQADAPGLAGGVA
jgi:nitrous oxidase accessory protein